MLSLKPVKEPSASSPSEDRLLGTRFSKHAWEDYLYWRKKDSKVLQRISSLIRDIERNPFEGIGKPEGLKHALSGWWSRRINDEHRIVYRVEGDAILIAQLRYHH